MHKSVSQPDTGKEKANSSVAQNLYSKFPFNLQIQVILKQYSFKNYQISE